LRPIEPIVPESPTIGPWYCASRSSGMRLTSDWPASGKVLLVSSTMPAVVMNRPRGLFSNVRMAAHCMKP
jgi:hypothetical protein